MKDTEITLLDANTHFDGLLDLIDKAISQRSGLHQVERDLFRALLRLGRSLLMHFLAQKGLGDVGPALSLDEARVLLRGDVETRPYRSIFGDVEIRRYVYGDDEVVAPLDAELNLPEWTYSYLLQEWGLGFTTQEAFGEVRKILDKLLGVDLSVHSLERISRKVAGGVTPFRQEQKAPPDEEEGAFLVTTVDCKGVPLTRKQDRTLGSRHRRKKGEKANKKKMACVGAVYTINPFERTADDILDEVARKEQAANRPGPQHKRVCADLLDDKETTFSRLANQVHLRQQSKQKPVLFLSDGERGLWKLKKKYLPDAVGILDLWHVMEYLWKGAHVFHKEGSKQAEDFVAKRLGMLLNGRVGYVIGSFKQMMTKHRLTGKKKKTIQDIITYYHNNRSHMHYDEYIAKGYPIGSGVAEGACRHLVKDRLERTGMRWTLDGAQAILDLRSTYLNEDWDAFWTHHTTAEQIRLYGSATFNNLHAYKATA